MILSTPITFASGISVVIPAYNAEGTLDDAIGSALAQTHAPLEILVIDDGSTDATAAIAARHAKASSGRVRVIRKENGGVASARNRGLAEARGDLIAFLDADDAWAPEKLAVQAHHLATRPEVVLVGTGTYRWPSAEPSAVGNAGEPGVRRIERERLAVRNHLVTSSVLLRRSAMTEAGRFDEELHGPEDHDYWLRVADSGAIEVIDAPLTGYRVVPGSLSRRARSMEEGMRRILRKLDARGFWRGRRFLRRRAYGHFYSSAAQLYASAGEQRTAMARLVASFFWYPLPFPADDAQVVLMRPRRLAVALMRALGLKRPDDGCA
jgi:glycosyltransferase involved in cell wall biosynthesis